MTEPSDGRTSGRIAPGLRGAEIGAPAEGPDRRRGAESAAGTDRRGGLPASWGSPDLRSGSGGPWEERFGYSRVRRVGPLAITAGCTATVDGAPIHPGDAGAQARVAFGIALEALARAGLAAADVVATRMYVTDRWDTDAVGAAHREVFGDVRPAATMVIVAGLIDPALLVEVELVAWAG